MFKSGLGCTYHYGAQVPEEQADNCMVLCTVLRTCALLLWTCMGLRAWRYGGLASSHSRPQASKLQLPCLPGKANNLDGRQCLTPSSLLLFFGRYSIRTWAGRHLHGFPRWLNLGQCGNRRLGAFPRIRRDTACPGMNGLVFSWKPL